MRVNAYDWVSIQLHHYNYNVNNSICCWSPVPVNQKEQNIICPSEGHAFTFCSSLKEENELVLIVTEHKTEILTNIH